MNLSSKTQMLWQSAKTHERIVALILFLAGMFVVSTFVMTGVDHLQFIRALQLEFSGKTAYGPEMAELFRVYYPEPLASAGFAYPLPAMWLALPVVFLPAWLQDYVWTLLSIAIVVVGLRLHRMPWIFVLFFPLIQGILLFRQATPMLVGMLLIGIWAVENKRWWLTGIIVALTIAAKPQTTLLLSSVLAVLALYRGGGKQIVLCGAVVALATFALEPTWIQQWFAALSQFQGTLERETYWQLAPLALLLWWRGYRWGAVAVLQYTLLFTGAAWYGLAVLTLCYMHVREGRMLWVVLLSSWLLYPMRAFSYGVYMLPDWVVAGIPCFLPLAWYAWRERNPPDSEWNARNAHGEA